MWYAQTASLTGMRGTWLSEAGKVQTHISSKMFFTQVIITTMHETVQHYTHQMTENNAGTGMPP